MGKAGQQRKNLQAQARAQMVTEEKAADKAQTLQNWGSRRLSNRIGVPWEEVVATSLIDNVSK